MTIQSMEWQGGRPMGTVCKLTKRNQFRVAIQVGSFKHFKDFRIGENEGETLQIAEEYRFKVCKENGLLKNTWRFVDEETIEMSLNHGKTTFFNKEHLDKFLPFVWGADNKKYATYAICTIPSGKRGTSKHEYMHRLIHPEWKIIDHIDGDGLNNRNVNLRDGSGGINDRNKRLRSDNTSGENGVYYGKTHVILRWWIKGKSEQKYFPYSKFSGEKGAFEAAVKYRDSVVYPSTGNTNGKRPKLQ